MKKLAYLALAALTALAVGCDKKKDNNNNNNQYCDSFGRCYDINAQNNFCRSGFGGVHNGINPINNGVNVNGYYWQNGQCFGPNNIVSTNTALCNNVNTQLAQNCTWLGGQTPLGTHSGTWGPVADLCRIRGDIPIYFPATGQTLCLETRVFSRFTTSQYPVSYQGAFVVGATGSSWHGGRCRTWGSGPQLGWVHNGAYLNFCY